MSKRKRSERRHHRERMEKHARKVFCSIWGLEPYASDANGVQRQVVRIADNLRNCSCAGCGNPRRHFGARTQQEKRAPTKADWDE